MRWLRFQIALWFFPAVFCLGWAVPAEAGRTCVWKVTGENGRTLFLGGSIHMLRKTDYPLPAAFNQAFEASSRLAFEVDSKAYHRSGSDLGKAGEYPRRDNLKNHVDPRTYDYLRRFFALVQVPEEKFSRFKPWALALFLQTPGSDFSSELGVESFLERRARRHGKAIEGLESAREHLDVFAGLGDRPSEALLLLTFIPAENPGRQGDNVLKAWRRGDAEAIWRSTRSSFRDYPALGDRLLEERNRRWMPHLDRYLRSGQTYFVVVGAAHLGGPGGLLQLLRQRGCRIEQL